MLAVLLIVSSVTLGAAPVNPPTLLQLSTFLRNLRLYDKSSIIKEYYYKFWR